MRSIKFPKMFNTNSTNVWPASEYLASTKQNTALLLHCEKGELLGDPYFGLLLNKLLYNPNNRILQDILVDMLYTQIALFIPQIKVKRQDITLITNKEKGKIYCTFSGVNQIDYTTNLYSLILFDTENK